jgi:hypothetical protein
VEDLGGADGRIVSMGQGTRRTCNCMVMVLLECIKCMTTTSMCYVRSMALVGWHRG